MKLKVAVALAVIATTPLAHAGFGDFLKNLEDKGKEVLEEAASGSSLSTSGSSSGLSTDTLIAGLKEALEVGSKRAIEEISAEGGYLNNADIKIPLPSGIDKVSGILRQYGLGSQVDAFEQSMNNAAEKAAPQATALIVDAIKEMSIEDAQRIYNGADDSATQYFKEKTYDKLTGLFKPTVTDSMNQVGVTQYYNQLAGEAKEIPFVGKAVELDLENYVTEGALDGLFSVLADEEKKIRENPTARTTELLKQVFN